MTSSWEFNCWSPTVDGLITYYRLGLLPGEVEEEAAPSKPKRNKSGLQAPPPHTHKAKPLKPPKSAAEVAEDAALVAERTAALAAKKARALAPPPVLDEAVKAMLRRTRKLNWIQRKGFVHKAKAAGLLARRLLL